MENNELQKIWKTFDGEIEKKSKKDLDIILTSKIKKTINELLIIVAISIIVCVGLIIYLIITSINRMGDLVYIINNSALGIITLVSLISALLTWNKFKATPYEQSLKEWLEVRINILSKWLTGRYSKMYLFLIPILYLLTILSIHVYFENRPFVEVIQSEDSIIGLLVGTIVGLFVSYYLVNKIRKYQLNKLESLKELYKDLSNTQ